MAPPAAKELKPLPYSHEDVTDDIVGFRGGVDKLCCAIISAINEGKSVTSVNKDFIVRAAREIRLSVDGYYNKRTGDDERYDPESDPKAYKNVRDDIIKGVQEEFSKLRELIETQTTSTQKQITSTYASIAGRQNPAQDTPGPAAVKTTPAIKPAPATPPVTRPAIVVASKTPTTSREGVLRNLKDSITFRDTKYAPAKVSPVSNNKLRIEFDSERDRDDTLKRIQNNVNSKVTAEVANRLKPMAILKGISNDVASEELVDIVLNQNPELGEFNSTHIKFKFKRDNRNSSLYNAVLITHPSAFRTLLSLERVRVDYQRVHVEEFSPFLQCHKCLQFGHTSTHCKFDSMRCAYCAETEHTHKDCQRNTSVSGDGSVVTRADATYKCHNCISHNDKYNNKYPTDHKATSNVCPIVRIMQNKTRLNIDYGTAPAPSPNRVERTVQ